MRPVAAIDSGPESNGGAIAGQVAQAFADVDAERAQLLDRLVKGPYANTDPRKIPPEVLHPETQEEAMAKERALCSKCGKNRIRSDNKSGVCNHCARPWMYADGEAKPRGERKPAQKAPHHVQPETVKRMSVAELLQVQGEIDDELRNRRDQAAEQLAELNRALGAKAEASGT